MVTRRSASVARWRRDAVRRMVASREATLMFIARLPEREISDELRELPIGHARGKSFAIVIEGRSIPLDVALLPVDQNMRRVGEAALIRDDIAKFLSRHGPH